MNCEACGFSNPRGFQFCGHCGQKLKGERPHEAERRQLTVMFFDLVGSTSLSGQLDPEELRDLVQTYQQVCNEVVGRYQGHVAQYLGDGILVYFGYPKAHPDDGFRAVSSALAILQAMDSLNQRLEAQSRPRLDLRVGIHTGLVVVGEMGSKEHREHLALGETPNVAARLQGLAGVNEVVFGSPTYLLVQDEFVVEELGLHSLKGVAEPIPVYRAVAWADAAERRRLRRQRRSAVPVVGRESYLQVLRQRWQQACQGQGSLLEVVGEPGIGKSRLLQQLKDEVAPQEPYMLSCYPQLDRSSVPWSGVASLLQREMEFSPPELSPLDKLLHLLQSKAPELDPKRAVPILSAVLQMDTSDFYPIPSLTPQSQRALTFETLNQLLLGMSRVKPSLLSVDGFEWLDPSSQEWLVQLAQPSHQARLLIVLTSRQACLTTQEPLSLTRLNREQAGQLVDYLLLDLNREATEPFCLSAESRRALLQRADGIPFYLEELTRTAFEKGSLDGLPGLLHDFLMARLDDLGSSKFTAQQASTIGMRFSRRLVGALAGSDVDQQVDCLIEQDVVAASSHGAELIFVQNLLREACYESLLKSVRQKYHSQIAQIFTRQFPHWAQQNPAVVAHHYLHSAQPSEAVPWLLQALLRSLACCALSEAVTASQQALEQLDNLSGDHPFQAHRLQLLTLQGSAWIGLRGYAAPEVESCYQQARQLCAALGDGLPVFPVLAGLWVLYLVQGKLHLAEEMSLHLLELSPPGSQHFRIACAARGQTRFFQGYLDEAADYLGRAMALYLPDQARGDGLAYLLTEPSIASASYLAYTHLLQGRPEQARECSRQARGWAEELDHPHTMAHTLSFEAWLLVSMGAPGPALELAGQLESLSRRQSFPLWLAMAQTFAGSSRLALGDGAGAALLREGLEAGQKTGAQLGGTWMLANLAHVVGLSGEHAKALSIVDRALQLAEATGERYCRPELLRLKSQWVEPERAADLLQAARQTALQCNGRWYLDRLG